LKLYWDRINFDTANMLQTLSGGGILRDFYSVIVCLSISASSPKIAQSKLESQSLFRKLEERFKTFVVAPSAE